MSNISSNEKNFEISEECGPVEKIHRQTTTGKVSDKWISYLKVYDRLFAPLQNRSIRLFEIGVQNGGSLDLWSKYFINAEVIVGCDINPRCNKLSYADSRIHVVVGDANESQTFEKVSQISDRFDIIIDDGSHRSDDILNSFNIYFPLLKPGGIFIVEDTHALYENGGLKQIKSAMAFFKLFADLVNYEFWKSDSTIEKLLNGFVSKTQLTDEVNAGWVESIEFRNSMIIIRKELTPTHSKLGARSIVGTEAVANDLVLKIKLGKVRSWKNPKTWF